MKIWKEVAATAVTGVALLLAFSVTQGWNWPLLADARGGIIALLVVGMGACALSGSAATSYSMKDPLLVLAVLAGIVAAGAGLIGLFANTMPYLVAMMIATATLWLLATVRHLIAASPSTGRLSPI